MTNIERLKLDYEKHSLKYTLYSDFYPDLKNESISKSIKLVSLRDGIATYLAAPYDSAYNTERNHFPETLQEIYNEFQDLYLLIFEKYSANQIVVNIFDDYSCVAGLTIDVEGNITKFKYHVGDDGNITI